MDSQVYKNFEVIIVDDGSTEDLWILVKNIECSYDLHFIRNSKNRDRSFARNTGMSIANGSSILILDPDMIPNPFHLLNIAMRAQSLDNVVIVGFKHQIDKDNENISYENIKNGLIEPDYKKDWRYHRIYDSTILPPNFMQIKEKNNRELFILNETDYFKKLGEGRIIGAWDIPSLVLGHTICFKKKYGIRAGGFAEEFIGWGHDDIAFAVRMIAKDAYVVPCVHSSSYHINHPPHSGSHEKKLSEFKTNLNRFLNYVETDLAQISFNPHTIKFKQKQNNKFLYEGP